MDNHEVRQYVARVEALLVEIEAMPDGAAKDTVVETIQILFELYGEGLARMLGNANRLAGSSLLNTFAEDELVSHLLLMHDLHPRDVESRVQQALQEVRPYMESHGGNVELLGVKDGVAHLRLMGSCNGCPSSSVTLKTAVEQAIQKAAPDLLGIETDSAVPVATGAFIPLSSL